MGVVALPHWLEKHTRIITYPVGLWVHVIPAALTNGVVNPASLVGETHQDYNLPHWLMGLRHTGLFD